MVQVDTSNYFEMWVRAVEPICDETCLIGEVFDDDIGFGLDQIPRFDGDVLFLSDEVHLIQHAFLSVIHVSRRGTLNTISEVERLPKPPFLITSNLLLKGPFRFPVLVEPTTEAVPFLDNPAIQEFPVAAHRMKGVLRETGKDYELIAFSEDRVLAGTKWELKFTDWDTRLGWVTLL